MTTAILDTTVLVHLIRKSPPALAWFRQQQATYSITSISWLEIMVGTPNKHAQEDWFKLLNECEHLFLTESDQQWTMIQTLRFSHSPSINDCLIAAIAYRLGVPLLTHNLKDIQPLIGALAVKPYP